MNEYWNNEEKIEHREIAEATMEKKQKKSGGLWRKALVACCCGLCFGLFGGLGFFAVNYMADAMEGKVTVYDSTPQINQVENKENIVPSVSGSIPVANTNQVTVVTSDYSQIVEEVMPAMVSILNTTVTKSQYWGQVYEEEEQYSGSGIIIAENGEELLIATNHHVVAGATKLEVNFIDGSIAEAQIKGTDADMDLAVIAIPLNKLEDTTKNAIVIAQMGDSDALKLGESVIAIGNALGYGQSVTAGYVSALDREVTMQDGSVGVFIQTDAAINPGNSGGALLNVKGEVIGINSSKIGGSMVEGMGYAIPISDVGSIIDELMLRRTRSVVDEEKQGFLGITGADVSSSMSQTFGIPVGVFVESVMDDLGAQKAGIKKGYVITKFDGYTITTIAQLQERLRYYKAGEKVEVTVKIPGGESGYEEKVLKVTLSNRSENTKEAE